MDDQSLERRGDPMKKVKWILLVGGIILISGFNLFIDPVLVHWDGPMVDGKMTGGAETDYPSTLTAIFIHSSVWLMFWGIVTGIGCGISASKVKKD